MFYKALALAKFLALRLRLRLSTNAPAHTPIAILDDASQNYIVGLFRNSVFTGIGNPGSVFFLNFLILRQFFKWFFKTPIRQ